MLDLLLSVSYPFGSGAPWDQVQVEKMLEEQNLKNGVSERVCGGFSWGIFY